MTVYVPNYFQVIKMIFHYYLWQSGDWGIFVAFSGSLKFYSTLGHIHHRAALYGHQFFSLCVFLILRRRNCHIVKTTSAKFIKMWGEKLLITIKHLIQNVLMIGGG